MVEEGITMDFAVHSHQDERTTAVLTSLVDLLEHISNHLGSPINFKDKPVKINKPASKKVPVGGKVITDTTSLGNKAIPNTASDSMPITIKKTDYTGSETGGMFYKEEYQDTDDDNIENLGLGTRLVAGALLGGDKDDERKAEINAMSTSEGKELLKLLEKAVEKLSTFLNTTRVPAETAMKPMGSPKQPPKF